MNYNNEVNQLRYVDKGRKKVKGWLSWVDAELIRLFMDLMCQESESLSILEIGVDRGKSFIHFALHEKTEKVVGIDLFANQSANVDHSGFGKIDELEAQLRKFGLEKSAKITLIHSDSRNIKASDLLTEFGHFSMCHIDGGHSLLVVLNDLEIAKQVVQPNGMIIVDDFLRPDWPDVSKAVFFWLESNKNYRIACIGNNKVYLTRFENFSKFDRGISAHERLKEFKRKNYELEGISVPVFFHSVIPEWNVKVRIYEYLRLYHPITFIRFKKMKKRVSKEGI